MIVARLLFGLANPSGKLPVSYPRAEADLPATEPLQWPGVLDDGGLRRVEYSEGLEIGCRWFDAQNIEPLFPFGYGLSYTTFSLSDIAVAPSETDATTPVKVTLTLTNTGETRGAEVPQVYLGFPAEAGEPPKRLVGFDKVWLDPGESRDVEITIDPGAPSHPFGIYKEELGRWQNPPGKYRVMVGTSAANIKETLSINLK
jgi:beta-glucosidase